MLVELGLVEQRYQAALGVLNDGATVTDVARRHGVAPDQWQYDVRTEGIRWGIDANLVWVALDPRSRHLLATVTLDETGDPRHLDG